MFFFVYMQTLYPSNPSPLLREGIVLYTCSYRTSSTSLFVYHPFFVLYCNIIHLQFLFSITLSIIRRYFCISLLFFITHDNLLLSFKLFLFFCTLHSFFSFEIMSDSHDSKLRNPGQRNIPCTKGRLGNESKIGKLNFWIKDDRISTKIQFPEVKCDVC